MNHLNEMYAQPEIHDKFSRMNRLVAEIATVKELLKEAKEYDDVLGTSTYTSRLDALDTERQDLSLKILMRVNQYVL